MIQELLYTSAPKGLKPGSRGFCTVLSTSGMPAPVATALESLSGYRPVYPPGDPQAKLNPVVYSHLKMSLGGRRSDVLSRVADYGLDYSQRTNKIAHHLVVDPNDRPSAGPAWLLAHPDVMRTSWEGEPHIVSGERQLPDGKSETRVCSHWKELTGDAGWAGVLAESFLKKPDQPAYIVFSPGMNLLPLIEEALALLPASKRWDVSFSTYFTKVPNGVTCNWRCVLADSPEAKESRRYVQSLRIDLTEPLGPATGGELVEAARTGRVPVESKEEPLSPPVPLKASQTSPEQIHRASDRPQLQPPAIKNRTEAPPIQHLPNRTTGWRKWIVATVVLILAGTSAAYFARQAPVVVTQAPPSEQHAPITPPEAPAPASEPNDTKSLEDTHTIEPNTKSMPPTENVAANSESQTQQQMPPPKERPPSLPPQPSQPAPTDSATPIVKKAVEQPRVIYFDLSDKDTSKPISISLPFTLENPEEFELLILSPTCDSSDVVAKGATLVKQDDHQCIFLNIKLNTNNNKELPTHSIELAITNGIDRNIISRQTILIRNKKTNTESFIIFSNPPQLKENRANGQLISTHLNIEFPNSTATRPHTPKTESNLKNNADSRWVLTLNTIKLKIGDNLLEFNASDSSQIFSWKSGTVPVAETLSTATKEKWHPIVSSAISEIRSGDDIMDRIADAMTLRSEVRSTSGNNRKHTEVNVVFKTTELGSILSSLIKNDAANFQTMIPGNIPAKISNDWFPTSIATKKFSATDKSINEDALQLRSRMEQILKEYHTMSRSDLASKFHNLNDEGIKTFISLVEKYTNHLNRRIKFHECALSLESHLRNASIIQIEVSQLATNSVLNEPREVPFLLYPVPVADPANPN